MANDFVDVALFAKAGAGFLYDSNPTMMLANKDLINFTENPAQLGDTVKVRLPIQGQAYSGFVPDLTQDTTDQFVNLTIDTPISISLAYDDESWLYNAKKWITDYAKERALTLGQAIAKDVTQRTAVKPFRAYPHDGTAISSVQDMAQAIANFQDFGVGQDPIYAMIPLTRAPAIIDGALTQFATNRNNELAAKWTLGTLKGTDAEWYTSNELPIHFSGTVGTAQSTLTLVSVNAAGTQLVFSGAGASDADAVKENDIFTFQDGVSGQTDIRFVTKNGYVTSDQPVQFRATADAASTAGGQVTVDISYALIDTSVPSTGVFQSISDALNAGMQVLALDSHRIGLLWSKPALIIAMPKLSDTKPYDSASYRDPMGASMRTWYGYIPEKAKKLFMYNCLYGTTFIEDRGMRLVFPL